MTVGVVSGVYVSVDEALLHCGTVAMWHPACYWFEDAVVQTYACTVQLAHSSAPTYPCTTAQMWEVKLSIQLVYSYTTLVIPDLSSFQLPLTI